MAIASELNAQYYFAAPYSSYQRGSNEHGNGMIRRYFPKGTDFSLVT
jgi:IS30 family transposase